MVVLLFRLHFKENIFLNNYQSSKSFKVNFFFEEQAIGGAVKKEILAFSSPFLFLSVETDLFKGKALKIFQVETVEKSKNTKYTYLFDKVRLLSSFPPDHCLIPRVEALLALILIFVLHVFPTGFCCIWKILKNSFEFND